MRWSDSTARYFFDKRNHCTIDRARKIASKSDEMSVICVNFRAAAAHIWTHRTVCPPKRWTKKNAHQLWKKRRAKNSHHGVWMKRTNGFQRDTSMSQDGIIFAQQCKEQSLRQRINEQLCVVNACTCGKRRDCGVVHQLRCLEGLNVCNTFYREHIPLLQRTSKHLDFFLLSRRNIFPGTNMQCTRTSDARDWPVWRALRDKRSDGFHRVILRFEFRLISILNWNHRLEIRNASKNLGVIKGFHAQQNGGVRWLRPVLELNKVCTRGDCAINRHPIALTYAHLVRVRIDHGHSPSGTHEAHTCRNSNSACAKNVY